MKSNHFDYVSVLFGGLLQPIADLVTLLDRNSAIGLNAVQTSSRENGYSVAIVALSVFVLESAVARTRFVLQDSGRRHAVDALKGLVSSSLVADAAELFVLRDAIAHNHIWEATVESDASGEMQLSSASLASGYGDARFKRAVDMATRTTHRLKLDVFPTRIHRATSMIVLKKVVEILRALEALDTRYVSLEMQPVQIENHRYVNFYDWVAGL